ncbi:hypothetical protein ACFL6G_03390 [candidate division KSB1 bacterium]
MNGIIIKNRLLRLIFIFAVIINLAGIMPAQDMCSGTPECTCCEPRTTDITSFEWDYDCCCCSTPVLEKCELTADDVFIKQTVIPQKIDFNPEIEEASLSPGLSFGEERDKIPKRKFIYSSRIYVLTSTLLI